MVLSTVLKLDKQEEFIYINVFYRYSRTLIFEMKKKSNNDTKNINLLHQILSRVWKGGVLV